MIASGLTSKTISIFVCLWIGFPFRLIPFHPETLILSYCSHTHYCWYTKYNIKFCVCWWMSQTSSWYYMWYWNLLIFSTRYLNVKIFKIQDFICDAIQANVSFTFRFNCLSFRMVLKVAFILTVNTISCVKI